MRTFTTIFTKKIWMYIPFWQIYQYLKLHSLPVLYCTTTVVLHYLAHCNASVVTCVVSICFRLFLPVPWHKILLPVQTINFLFLLVLLELQICVASCCHPFLFNWHTSKTKTPILLYIMQHPRQFLIVGINLNEFSVT